ncbi:POTRA domain-containing protein [Confluentibacter citreus]|uniref:POTRA domain-containing protein n=1 Tax=Confluentibacter citreus TaxID=2007307 RepID=UPI000C289F9E|nr:POTRA domain-containing protein [Confluentibacter citreus]
MKRFHFLLLIIYILFSSKGFSQNLRLNISGDSDIENQVIDSLNYTKTHQDYLSISSELDSIQKTLLKIGYIENKLGAITKINDSTFSAKIHFKKKYHTIYIYYDKNLVDKSLLNLVSNRVNDSCFVLPIKEVEDKLNFINSKITSAGLPFSKLQLSDIEVRDNDLKAHLLIGSDTKKRIINDIIIRGYEKFPLSYLKHYLKIKRNQIFDLNKIKSKTEQLNDLRFASQIKSPEVLFSKDSTTLYIYLEKSKSNSFDGFLGFGTNEDTNQLQFDGYLNLNLTNNLNYGESFRLLYKSDENDQKTFQTDLTLPYLFSSPIGLDLQLYIFKRDSSFTTVNQFAKLHYQINSKHKIYSGITSTQSNNLLNNNTSNLITDFDASYFTSAYEYINPQSYNVLFPVNTSVYLETNFGKRKTSTLIEDQTQLGLNSFKIFNFNNRNSVFIKIDTKTLISDTYFENELLRFGGINSIRGFEENSLLADSFGVLNSEYRFQINNAMYIHTITDVAYFENKITNTQEKLFGYGFGFGILTNSGLLKLNYANGKSENQKFKLSNSKIHISLTANF